MGCRFGKAFLDTPSLDQIVQPRAFAVGAVAIRSEEANDRGGGRNDLARLEQHPTVSGKAAMPSEPTKQHSEVDARRRRSTWPDPDCSKAEVGSVFKHRDAAAAVEGDVELSRQPVQFSMIKNIMVDLTGQRAGVD